MIIALVIVNYDWIMKTIKRKHIVIFILLVFFAFVFLVANRDKEAYENLHPYNQSQSHNPSSKSYKIHSPSHHQSTQKRHEILQTKVKGYRETTYWGSEHPIQERTRYLNDEEFDRFMNEEVEMKDADIYWGAEY